MSKTQKYRNIRENPNVSFVVDDVLPPWQPRGIEIRGIAQALSTGGKALFGPQYAADDALIRISPLQIIRWGLETESRTPLNRKVK